VKIQDFVVGDNKGTPVAVEEGVVARWAASDWITVSPSKFTINPGETKLLDFVAVVPQDASPGGHYAVVYYSPVPGTLKEQEGETTSQTGTSLNIGTLVYLTVPGEIRQDARVIGMTAPKFSEYGPVKITTEIENFSDIHIKPRGVVRVYNWLGKLNRTLKLNDNNIFPGASRLYENNWPQKWAFGKYRAQIQAGYGTQGSALAGTVFFWVIPWRLITITILTIVLAILLVTYFKKTKKK